jgi:hypothetical protein
MPSAPTFQYSPERREVIKRALALDEEDFESAIEDIEGWAQHLLNEAGSTFSPTKARAGIRAVHKNAEALKAALEAADPAYLAGFRNLDAFARRLEQLSATAAEAGNRPIPRGVVESVAEKWFVAKLRELYEYRTGKKATITFDPHKDRYGGRFFNMVKACLGPPLARHSDGALVKLIKRAGTMDKKSP